MKNRIALTDKQREMLHRAAQFVLAGEWPWEDGAGGARLSHEVQARERDCLDPCGRGAL